MKPKILIQDDVYGEFSKVYINGELAIENLYNEPRISYIQLMEIVCRHYDINCEVQVGQFVGEDFYLRKDARQFKSQ